jgi:hypothetical protein
MVALELSPNKYLANAFVLIKIWSALQAAVFAATLLTFKSRLPSPSTINWALTITRQDKTKFFQRIMAKLYRCQSVLVAVAALLVGQWFIMLCYMLFLASMFSIHSAAVDYLKGMHIDLDKKKAVIDV